MNIPGKYKAFGLRFLILIVLLFGLMLLFQRLFPAGEYNEFLVLGIPVIIGIVAAPRVQFAQHQSGKRYGLKFIFYPKIWWFD